MSDLNLDHLRSFAAVVSQGSFSAAGALLGLTQPAISMQVKQLEQRLALKLIERVGRRATPTAAGSDLLAHIGRVEGALADMLEAMAAHATGVTGRVRLGTGPTACIYLIPPLLKDLRRRFPQLEIVVATGNTGQMLKLLEDNRLDVAFVTLPAPGRMFQVTPVIDDEFIAIFAAGDERIPASATPTALAKLPIVLEEPGATSRGLMDRWFAKAGVMPKPVTELGSTEAIKKVVGAGLGCSIMPRMALTGTEKRDGIVYRPLSPPLQRQMGLVLRRDKPLQRGLRELVNAILALAPKAR